MMILCGDIGGTKSRVALYQNSRCIAERQYANEAYINLSEVLRQFMASYSIKVDGACFGVAGVVRDNVCKMTNLSWVIDASLIAEELNISQVWLINDLEAHAYGINRLSVEDFEVLNEGSLNLGNAAFIAAGTGLGEVGLYWDGKRHHCIASEGGHTDFAPRDDLEIALFQYLRKKFAHVSYERVLSGEGLKELFYFFIEVQNEKKPDWLMQMESEDISPLITEKALNKTCKLCMKVLECFISIYGSESGNMALKFLSLGGFYVGGTIACKIAPALKEETFMKNFRSKGRFEHLLSKIPIKIILNDRSALLGAREFARMQLDLIGG